MFLAFDSLQCQTGRVAQLVKAGLTAYTWRGNIRQLKNAGLLARHRMPTLLQPLFVFNSQPQPAKVMVSLQKTVELNPRHFEALEQLGEKLEEYGDKAGALKMYRRALALDPNYEGLQRHIDGLTRAVEGQGI